MMDNMKINYFLIISWGRLVLFCEHADESTWL